MKPTAPGIRELVFSLRRGGKSYGQIATLTGVTRGAVVMMCFRARVNPDHVGETPAHVNPGQWCSSLHHEGAHFVTEGKAACGTTIPAGSMWHVNTDIRRCRRCMHHTERQNDSDQPTNPAE